MERLMPSTETNSDPLDFSDKYNTTLPTPDLPTTGTEGGYLAWVDAQTAATGRNVGNDSYDYDLRGWYKENGPQDLSDAHLTDKYKKPNHPTFSDQSIYHGVDGHVGGTWDKQPGTLDQYDFTPGPTNYHSIPALQDYFKQVEPANTLNVPQSFEINGGGNISEDRWLSTNDLPKVDPVKWQNMLDSLAESKNVEDRRTTDDKRYEDLATQRDAWLRDNKLDSSINYRNNANVSSLRGPVSKEDWAWMQQHEVDKRQQSSDLTIESLDRKIGNKTNPKDIPIPRPRR